MKDGFDSESRSVDANGGRNGESLNLGQAGIPLDRLANENKVKKVKLKVGGVTRTIQANTTSNGAVGGWVFYKEFLIRRCLKNEAEA